VSDVCVLSNDLLFEQLFTKRFPTVFGPKFILEMHNKLYKCKGTFWVFYLFNIILINCYKINLFVDLFNNYI